MDAKTSPRVIEERWMLDSVLDGLPALVYFKDVEGRYVRVSRNYLEVSGIASIDELLGRTDAETGMEPAQAESLRLEDVRLLHGVDDIIDHEEHIVGRVRAGWYKTVKHVIRDEAGAVVGTYGVSLDITERKHAEEEAHAALAELAGAQSELVQARKLEAIGQLAAGVAHEINTPIQFVSDNSHFALDGVRDLLAVLAVADAMVAAAERGDPLAGAIGAYRAERERADIDFLDAELPLALEQTIEGTQRVGEIVRALKEFAHPANDAPTTVDLNRVIATTLTVSKNEWKYAADVHFDPDPGLPMIAGLPGPLQQALLILVVNAAQAIGGAGAGHGRIDVATSYDDQWVTIQVTDDGPGIPEAIRDRIFEPFFTTKAVGQGTGQGLSVARSIVVKRHHGEITFTTSPGSGTTFVIRLPREGDAVE